MWIFTKRGWFSAVNKAPDGKRDGDTICVRSRLLKHANNFAEAIMRQTGKRCVISTDAGTDYRYRSYVSREVWTEFVRLEAQDVDYGNFKDALELLYPRTPADTEARLPASPTVAVAHRIHSAAFALEQLEDRTRGKNDS